jgi:hypothetical protein
MIGSTKGLREDLTGQLPLRVILTITMEVIHISMGNELLSLNA